MTAFAEAIAPPRRGETRLEPRQGRHGQGAPKHALDTEQA